MRKPLSLLLALLGLFDALYLLWSYTSPSRPMLCFGTGCDAVRASAYSHVHGVPMPVFGVAGYLLIAFLIIGESLVPVEFTTRLRQALVAVTGFGFLFSLYLEYLQGFVIHAFCAWCVTSGVVMTALFGLASYNLVRPTESVEPAARLSQVRQYFVLSILALMVGVPAFYGLASRHETAPPPPPAPTENTADRLVRPDSHVWGNPNALVTVVEFGDFECPVCATEAEVVRQIRAKYANQIRFVFRQFPLMHIHPFAARMAEASECAARQGKFWEAVDKIYAHQTDLTEQGLERDAAEIGLDLPKFEKCMASGEEAARVQRDHDDGKALGVNATPTFFIGHRVLTDVPGVDELSHLIDEQLAQQGGPEPPRASAQPAPAAAKPTKNSAPPKPSLPSAPASSSPPGTSNPSTSSFGTLGSPGAAFSSFSSGGVTCSEAEAAMKQPTLINTDQLKDLLDGSSKPLFVDVRPAKEFEAGHIPGAINLPIDDVPQHWNTLPKDRMIVFYESGRASGDICASGRAAGRILLQHGYPMDQVKVYQDGYLGWQKSGLAG